MGLRRHIWYYVVFVIVKSLISESIKTVSSGLTWKDLKNIQSYTDNEILKFLYSCFLFLFTR